MLKSVWWIETTERCNLRCRFCYNAWRSSSPSTHRDVALNDLTRALEIIAHTFSDSRLVLSGGDVSVRGDFHELVALATSLAPTALVTNGEQIDTTLLHHLSGCGVAEIQFSVHSHKARTHQTLTGGGDLKRTLKAVDHAVGVGLEVSLVMVLTEHNIGDVYGVAYLASQLGVATLVLNPVIPSGRALRFHDTLPIAVPQEVLYRRLAEAKRQAAQLGVQLLLGSPFRDDSLNDLFGGMSDKLAEMKLVLDHDFAVKPCSSSTHRFGFLDEFAASPQALVNRYRRFWGSGQPVAGCRCSELRAANPTVDRLVAN